MTNLGPIDGEARKGGDHAVVRRLTFQGLKIAVETDKGQERRWYDPAAREHGTTRMRYPYGYFEGTKKLDVSGDGGSLDVYVGPVEDAEEIYVVRQMKRPEFKEFDEYKVMVGFESEKRARLAYLMHYNDDRFLGSVQAYDVQAFKDKFVTPAVAKAMQDMPPGHRPGMVVPKGGSSCSSCKFVTRDEKHCGNAYWIDWRRGDSKLPAPADEYCCDMYEPAHAIEQPSVAKALAGKDAGVMLSSAAGQPEQFVNPAGMRPGMPPQFPMAPMGPPPLDVETLEGVKSLLGRVGSMKDGELLRLAAEIWGPGYQFINATAEHVRCEIVGFLLDQRDLLELSTDPAHWAPPPPPVLPMQPGLPQSMLSGAAVPPAQSGMQNSFASSAPSPPASSSTPASSSSPATGSPSARTPSQTTSSSA